MPELIALRESEDVLTPRNRLNLRAAAYFRDITSMVNASTNEVGEINTQLAQNQQSIARINELEKRRLVTVKTTTDITAKPYEQIVCNNTVKINVTLDLNPRINDLINIKRKNKAKTINVIGIIDGETNKCINVKNYNMKLLYDGDEWIEV